jgi:hypothetical protein
VTLTANSNIFRVFDQGATGTSGWTASLDGVTLGASEAQGDLNLVPVGANSLFVQAGAGFRGDRAFDCSCGPARP